MMRSRIVIKSASEVKGSDASIQVTGKQLKQDVKCEKNYTKHMSMHSHRFN